MRERGGGGERGGRGGRRGEKTLVSKVPTNSHFVTHYIVQYLRQSW